MTDEIEAADTWAAQHAPDLAPSIADELRAPRLATGESAGKQEQRPQEFGGDHGQPVLSLTALGLEDVDPSLDGSYRSTGNGNADDIHVGTYDEATGPPIHGRYAQRELHAVTGALPARDPEDPRANTVRAAVETMSPAHQETFRLVYGERVSQRAAAERLGVSQAMVRKRLEAVEAVVTRALVASASEDHA